VTRITQPDGSYLNYSYDGAHRLMRVSDAVDERIDYTLDAMGGRTLEQISTSGGAAIAKTQSRVFDVLGRLLQGIGAASQTTSYAYDNDGNLAQITDPLSNVTGQSFDALNRLIQVAAPLSSTTAYGYDAHDNRTSVTDPRGLVTSYVYDGLDNLIQVTSPDTGTTVYVVDDAGNRIEQTDAAGVTMQMSYDALNRLTAKTYPADPAENVTYRYDEPAAGFGVGRLTSVSDTSGSTTYVYDARGNVVQETHVVGAQSYITGYAYDLANHVVQITYPSGRIVSYTRDAMGRISDVTTQANSLAGPVTVASGVSYAPFGPLTALTYGNGLSLSATYDEDYQPSARLVAGASSVQDLAYGFDADGNVTGITDHLAAARSQIFQYDALNRLTYASGLYGPLAYGYDAVGNRTSQSGGTTNLAETYAYAANSNQLQSVVNGTVTRSLGYSPIGNVASDNRGNGTALSFTYDLSDRMVQVANQNTPLASYAYNFDGQRVSKNTPSTITQFVYDRSGHLLAESNGATGAAQTEYVWLDGTPLAIVTGGALYFIHPDHLDTPQKATDASQNLAWDIVARPFGQTEQQTFPPLSSLRFPGQYFDSESGLAQNWFRDYDPSIGRYIESDPIGLDGGINSYGYVGSNPALFLDPLGLQAVPVPGPMPPPGGAGSGRVPDNAQLPTWLRDYLKNLSDKFGGNDCCGPLTAKINDQINAMKKTYNDMAADKNDLFNNAYGSNPGGSLAGKGYWKGHVTRFEGLRVGLARMVRAAEVLHCPVPPEAYEWLGKPAPLLPFK
jgi:RHS repeat-associated protein